ncbi:hypothetical protein POV27_00610 [Aureisphaera galaxeae]|uniref:hypothetical protein n=1 Tax=Aureisphaera galaxeae TaxID=1538023 RepID=UPI0023503C52|nr:hypothetical protein [Aureisphaera galaxeae]MDC8002537.1 hypothetical protein [Aureisphaera galaxeae]
MVIANSIFDSPWVAVTVVLLVIGGFAYGYFFSKKIVLLREMRKSKSQTIGRAQEGKYTKIVGKAKHVTEPMLAPISKRPCIFYHITVIQGSGKNRRTIIDDMQVQDFFIEKDGEMAMVKMDQPPTFRNVVLVEDHQYDSGIFKNPSEHVEKYLNKHGKDSKYWLGFNKDLKYWEGIIGIDEIIAVKGIAEWKSLKNPIEGYHYSKILSLRGSKDKKLLITDHKRALKDPKS